MICKYIFVKLNSFLSFNIIASTNKTILLDKGCIRILNGCEEHFSEINPHRAQCLGWLIRSDGCQLAQ